MYRELSVQDAHSLMVHEGYTYVDVRTEREFAAGHPSGAVNIPGFLAGPGGMMPNPLFLQMMQRLYATDAKLLVGCAAGGRSARMCQLLEGAGYGDLVNVAGGFSGARDGQGQVVTPGWESEGLPAGTDGTSYADMQSRARQEG